MRLLVLAFLVIATAAAAAAPAAGPVGSTSCWDCHAPGKWLPALEEPRLTSYHREAGDAMELVVVLENPWLHELRRVHAVVTNLEEAGLEARPGGSTTIERSGAVPSRVLDAPWSTEIDLPPGTQGIAIEVVSDAMHDLDLVVRPGGQEPRDELAYGPLDIAAAGWSGWIFEVHRRDVLPGDAPFELRIEADASARPEGWLGSAPPAPPMGATEIRWPVAGQGNGRTLDMEVVFLMEYPHDDPQNPDVASAHIRGAAAPEPLAGEEPDQEVPVPLLLAVASVACAALVRRRLG